MVDMFAGGAISRMTVFALGIMPYISASIIMQLLTSVSPTLEAWKKEGESGRRKINQWTRYGTLILAAVAVARHRQRPAEHGGAQRRRRGHRPRLLLHLHHGGDADLRHHVPDVAGRADHRPRHRQRHLAHHLRRHRRAPAERPRPDLRAAARRLHQPDPGDRHRDRRGRGHHLRGVLRARAAPPDRAVSQATSRQPHVRRRILASAAEAQHVGRHPADLRVFAAAAAADGRQLLFQPGGPAGVGADPASAGSATASRSISPCISG